MSVGYTSQLVLRNKFLFLLCVLVTQREETICYMYTSVAPTFASKQKFGLLFMGLDLTMSEPAIRHGFEHRDSHSRPWSACREEPWRLAKENCTRTSRASWITTDWHTDLEPVLMVDGTVQRLLHAGRTRLRDPESHKFRASVDGMVRRLRFCTREYSALVFSQPCLRWADHFYKTLL